MVFRFILFLNLSFIHLYGVVSPNPFLRPGSNQKPPISKPLPVKKTVIRPNVAKEVDFKGYFILKGQPYFSLFNRKVNHSEWITLSEKTYEEFMAQSFDLETETLTVLYEGQSFDLKLIDAKSGSGLPTSIGNPSPVTKSVPGAGKPTVSKRMPPKPSFVPSLPANVPFTQNRQPVRSLSGFTSNGVSSSRSVPGLSLPGLPYPGALPRRSVPSNPSNNVLPSRSGQGNTLNGNSGSSGISTPGAIMPNNTLATEPVDSGKSETSDAFNLQNLPPPPPPPNILPPSPPPNVQPARE